MILIRSQKSLTNCIQISLKLICKPILLKHNIHREKYMYMKGTAQFFQKLHTHMTQITQDRTGPAFIAAFVCMVVVITKKAALEDKERGSQGDQGQCMSTALDTSSQQMGDVSKRKKMSIY